MVGAAAMEQAIEGLASHLREGDRIGSDVGRRIALPQAVVITGMGGSAMGGELLRGLIASHCPVPITRVRGFGIPGWAGAGTLVVCVSYSGNTLETLSCAERAHRQGAAILVVGSGGTLGDLADAGRCPSPRCRAACSRARRWGTCSVRPPAPSAPAGWPGAGSRARRPRARRWSTATPPATSASGWLPRCR